MALFTMHADETNARLESWNRVILNAFGSVASVAFHPGEYPFRT